MVAFFFFPAENIYLIGSAEKIQLVVYSSSLFFITENVKLLLLIA